MHYEYPEFFRGRPIHTSNSQKGHHGWRWAGKFLKFVPSDALKMHSLALYVLKFVCKAFSKLLKFTLWYTRGCGWILKKSYIQIINLYEHKLVRIAKWSELKRCSK